MIKNMKEPGVDGPLGIFNINRHITVLFLLVIILLIGGCAGSKTIIIDVKDASDDVKKMVGTFIRVKNVASGRYLSMNGDSVFLATLGANTIEQQSFLLDVTYDPEGKPLFVLMDIGDNIRAIRSGEDFRPVRFEPEFENVFQVGKVSIQGETAVLINQPLSASGPLSGERLKVAWTDTNGKISLENQLGFDSPVVKTQFWKIEPAPRGPENLYDFLGKWELMSTFHSNDHNSITGITINKRNIESSLASDGWQSISIVFEDGYTIVGVGKDGNVALSNGYSIDSVGYDHFYLVDGIGNRDKIEKYDENADLGFLLFHNSAAYNAHVWGSWTEIGFGGIQKNVTTDKVLLSLAGGLDAIGIHDEHVFTIPRSAKNVNLYIDPVDGRDKIIRISNPPIDNSCYRIRGDLISAALDANYNYFDKDCSGSSSSGRIETVLNFQNSKLFKALASRILELHQSGFFSVLDLKNSSTHETVKKMVFNEQMKIAIDNHNAAYVGDDDDPGFSVNSFSVGVGGGFELLVGYSGDGGTIYDIGEKWRRNYGSNGFSFGVEAGANLSLVIGLWKDHVREMTSGWAYGSGVGIAWDIGATVLGWSPELRSKEISGITIAIDFGAEGKVFEILKSYTSLEELIPY